jgi:DNA-binding response OmpR family regulator
MSKPENKSKGTILIVDDELEVVRMVARFLSAEGYNVLAADSPSKARELCMNSQSDIDLLLSDFNMPETNGLILGRELQMLHSTLRLMFMSGSWQAENQLQMSGFVCLRKPFQFPDLISAIDQTLNRIEEKN